MTRSQVSFAEASSRLFSRYSTMATEKRTVPPNMWGRKSPNQRNTPNRASTCSASSSTMIAVRLNTMERTPFRPAFSRESPLFSCAVFSGSIL